MKPTLYSIDLKSWETLKPTPDSACFFIVEHTEFFKELAAHLLLSGCRNFDFYGSKESNWHFGFDWTDIDLFPDSDNVALTSGSDGIEEFVDGIQDTLDLGHSVYLFYDDERIFRRVCELLNDAGKKE